MKTTVSLDNCWDYYESWRIATSGNPSIFVLANFDEKNPNDWSIKLMAAKRKEVSDESIGKWNGIVDVPVDADAKAAVLTRIADDMDGLEDDITTLLEHDYKVVVRWDTRSDCPIVSLSCYDATSPNYKYTMVTRAPTMVTALALMVHKHFKIASEVWTSGKEKDIWA